MRVEKFSLFFPPTLLRKQVGETEYAIGAIPAGGYVKISGMNPDGGPPRRGPRPGLLLPAGVEADRGDRGRPGGEPGAGVRAAVRLLLRRSGRTTATTRVGAIEKGLPGRGRAQAGRRLVAVDGKRGDAGRSSKQIAAAPVRPEPAHRRLQGARTPATLMVERDGSAADDRAHADLRPAASARGSASRTPTGPRENLPVRARRSTSRPISFWFITQGRRSSCRRA